MIKRIFILLLFVLVSTFSYGQALTCEKLAKQIESDTTISIWNLKNITLDTYYCLGKYFAKRDINNNIFLIQTYGLPEDQNPCIVCRYNSIGFSFVYHDDIIVDKISQFIDGYNEISQNCLKLKIGDSAFASLDNIPDNSFNPREVLNKNLNTGEHLKYFDIDIINDTIINVKLLVDSLFKEYPNILTKIVFDITDLKYTNKGQPLKMSYQQIKEIGFRLNEKSSDKYYFNINFDFKAILREEKYCWCNLMDKEEYNYVIPLLVK